jgi:hypothetical protein
MRKPSAGLIFAVAVFALGAGGAVAQHDRAVVGFEASAAQKADQPPRASEQGKTSRSKTARTKGANNPDFCPPGQRRKPGKGSAHQC